MIRIAHIFDESTDWSTRIAAGQIIDRLDGPRYAHQLIAIDRSASAHLNRLDRKITLIPRRLGFNALAAPRLRALLNRQRISLVHAWGADAAVAAAAAGNLPTAVSCFDPVRAKRDARVLRSLADRNHPAIVASCQIVRRRLIEGGVDPQRVVVVRPGVDFAAINRIKRSDLRTQLGVARDVRLVCLAPPLTRETGTFDAALGVHFLDRIDGPCRVALIGGFAESDRIERFHQSLSTGNVIVQVSPDVPVESLIAVSDAMVIAASDDVATTAIAWAMASKTPVVGAAGYAVAELVANKVNGLLFKATEGRSMAPAVARCLSDRSSLEKAAEAAHGQAYEVFGVRRCVEDYGRVYENVLANQPPGAGIVDSALAG